MAITLKKSEKQYLKIVVLAAEELINSYVSILHISVNVLGRVAKND